MSTCEISIKSSDASLCDSDSCRKVIVVHISDTHNKTYKSLPVGDILIHSGDFTNHGTAEEISDFATYLTNLPFRYKVVICGNHEWGCDRLPPTLFKSLLGPNVIMLQDNGVCLMGINIWGSAWNNRTRMAFGAHEEFRREKWGLIPTNTHILITHNPPFNVLDLAYQPQDKTLLGDEPCITCDQVHKRYKHWGCRSLLERVHDLNIPLHLFGHVHDEVGIKKVGGTTFCNGALALHRKANVIHIDIRPITSTECKTMDETAFHCPTASSGSIFYNNNEDRSLCSAAVDVVEENAKSKPRRRGTDLESDLDPGSGLGPGKTDTCDNSAFNIAMSKIRLSSSISTTTSSSCSSTASTATTAHIPTADTAAAIVDTNTTKAAAITVEVRERTSR